MGCARVILAIIFPPLAVLDKGCGPIIMVTFLTVLGYIPGLIAAIIMGSAKDED